VAARHPAPAPIDPDTPSADIRIAYARCTHLSQELQSQLDALAKHGIPGKDLQREYRHRLALSQGASAPDTLLGFAIVVGAGVALSG
jgi:hypothetical protein